MVFPATAALLKDIAVRFSCQQNSIPVAAAATGHSILAWRQDPERSLVKAKFHRAIADQFTVELHRHGLVAFHAQSPGLKIFDFRNANVRTEDDVLQIFNDFEIAETFEDDHIQEPVIEQGMFEKWKRTTIQTSIPNQNERTLINRRILGLNE